MKLKFSKHKLRVQSRMDRGSGPITCPGEHSAAARVLVDPAPEVYLHTLLK
jgi:hypothetical protein